MMKTFQYDAFVSYADEDNDFVVNHVVTQLESSGSRLLLHRRDVLAGNTIADYITNAVHKSRKTVTILTASYLKSNWCMYIFNMAHMVSIYITESEKMVFLW